MDKQEPFHAQVRAELRSIPVPADLRERILANAPKDRIVRPSFWRPALAVAAGFALLASLFFFWQRHPGEDQSFAGFQSRMTGFAVRQYSMDFLTNDLGDVLSRLGALGAPADFHLPAPLAAAPVKGGARLSWQGRPVAMVCFDGPEAKTLYLFVIDAEAVPAAPQKTELERSKGLTTAAWTTQGKTYLLAAEVPEPALRAYL